MEIRIKNIGAIGDISIKMEGITVIAGENSTGKSTIGKCLYALLHDMSKWDSRYEKLCREKAETVLQEQSVELEDMCLKETDAKRRRTTKAATLRKEVVSSAQFMVAVEDFQYSMQSVTEQTLSSLAKTQLFEILSDYFVRYVYLYTEDSKKVEDIVSRKFTDWALKTAGELSFVQIDELVLQSLVVKNSFAEVFKNQYLRIGSNNGLVSYTDSSKRKVSVSFSEKEDTLDKPVRVKENIYYLESPKVFDMLSDPYYGSVQTQYLRYLLTPNVFKNQRNKKISFPEDDKLLFAGTDSLPVGLLNTLEKTMGGKAEFYQKIGLEFKDSKITESIHSVNVSAGLKSMALLEYALRIGSILPGDILILDEPEINLHPSWQLDYAKALVTLQKQYNLTIVIASHSPYFIRAIEVYSALNTSMDKLNVYLLQRDADNIVKAENMSYSEYGISEVYERLSSSLDKLETVLEEKYGADR